MYSTIDKYTGKVYFTGTYSECNSNIELLNNPVLIIDDYM